MDLRHQHNFFCQLDLLIKTGTPISQALELVADSPDPESAEAGQKLLRRLETGVPLSASFGEVFGPVTGGLLGIAERTGSLVQTLQGIASRCSDQIRRQDEVRSAVVYPLGVLLLSVVVGATIIVLLLPQLLPFVTSLGVPLPWPTRVLVVINKWSWVWANLLFLPLSALAVMSRTHPERLESLKLWLRERTPLLAPILRQLDLAHACQDLRLCITAGLGFHEALKLLSRTCPSPSLAREFTSLSKAIFQGEELEVYFQQNDELKGMFGTAVVLGQEAGKLPEMLNCAARILQDNAEFQLRSLITLIEPAAMATVSLTVGFLAVAGLMPIYQVVTAPF